jgi:excinuclease ABC subunit A
MLSRYRGRTTCPDCEGSRLRKEALYVKINGVHIGTLSNMPVKDLSEWLKQINLSEYDRRLASRIMIELRQRIDTLLAVGLGYLTLNRPANTLSGGESQRIQLTRMLGSNLTDSLYILDEPSIGLHPRDTAQLIGVLKSLRDLGNTVVVVEHDEMMMREADHIIDMGPMAGYLGGRVMAEGDIRTILSKVDSLTGQYLSGKRTIAKPATERLWTKSILIEGAQQHNLKNIDVKIVVSRVPKPDDLLDFKEECCQIFEASDDKLFFLFSCPALERKEFLAINESEKESINDESINDESIDEVPALGS